jgi:hypothetical protein
MPLYTEHIRDALFFNMITVSSVRTAVLYANVGIVVEPAHYRAQQYSHMYIYRHRIKKQYTRTTEK